MTLTQREVEIRRMVSRGKTSQEIADNLRISEVTVKWHVGNSMRKLGAASRAEAVAIALRQGIL